ncbi:hypothetical protein [Streptomyces sp. NPDC088755]|uniref:hypothetical protein n=1 Tax=Streptomyces sp. NPDC088755 TaxID=3365888 RepID=UPI0037F6CF2A
MINNASRKHHIATQLLESDLMFSRRFLEGMLAGRENATIPYLCMNNYLSLFIYESHRALKAIDPQRAAALTYSHEAVIEKARHTVKLFDGSKVGHASILNDFTGIIAADRNKFLGNTWLPPARVLETDLGEWRYRGRLVSTTQVASFFSGIPSMSTSDISIVGRALMALAETQARFFVQTTESLPWHGASFISGMHFGEIRNRDRRSEWHFKRLFDK